jgi:hypothetical protein
MWSIFKKYIVGLLLCHKARNKVLVSRVVYLLGTLNFDIIAFVPYVVPIHP